MKGSTLGDKLDHRYKLQHRLYRNDWSNIDYSFSHQRDALDYASMCSCYPLIYGQTRVIDSLSGLVIATFNAGEGLKEPQHKPGMPPYKLQLRYTVTPKGETWGWLSRTFLSFDAALDFARRQIFPRNICDAVRVVKDGEVLATWIMADSISASKRETHHGDPAKTFVELKDPPRQTIPMFEQFKREFNEAERETRGLPKTMFGLPVKSVALDPAYSQSVVAFGNLPRLKFEESTIPGFDELVGRNTHLGETRHLFAEWFQRRFKTVFNLEIGLHCAMLEAFRAALAIRVVRPHQG